MARKKDDTKEPKKRAALVETRDGFLNQAGDFEQLWTAEQLNQEKRRDASFFNGSYRLRFNSKKFITGNYALYRNENGKAVLYIGGNEGNPILRAPQWAYEALYSKTGARNYELSEKSIDDAVQNARGRAVLDELDLENDYYWNKSIAPWGHVVAHRTNNTSQRNIVKAVFGRHAYNRKFHETVEGAVITILQTAYVLEHAQSGIVRACSINFKGGRKFSAIDHACDDYLYGLRGIPKPGCYPQDMQEYFHRKQAQDEANGIIYLGKRSTK